MMRHLVSEHDQRVMCLYCQRSLDKQPFVSVFESWIHYKVFDCECGKQTRLKVNFQGSGHDSWDGTHAWKECTCAPRCDGQLSPLESRIKKIDKPEIKS